MCSQNFHTLGTVCIILGSPEAPHKPSVQISKGQVHLSWENGKHGTSPIIGYYIQARSMGKYCRLCFSLLAYVVCVVHHNSCQYVVQIFYTFFLMLVYTGLSTGIKCYHIALFLMEINQIHFLIWTHEHKLRIFLSLKLNAIRIS